MALAQAAIDEKMAENIPKEVDGGNEEIEETIEDNGDSGIDEVEFVQQGDSEDGDEYDQRLRRLLDR